MAEIFSAIERTPFPVGKVPLFLGFKQKTIFDLKNFFSVKSIDFGTDVINKFMSR